MNGVHDMGGMDGFGKVEPEANEPVFHAEWEARVMAMNRALGAAGAWNLDMSRHSREVLPGHVYLGSSYYAKWLIGMEQMLVDRGMVTEDELAAGHAIHPPKPPKRGCFEMKDVPRVLARGSFYRPAEQPARFKIGDRVRCKNIHPVGHTRLPRYVRGRVGVIERVHGTQVFPDTVAVDGTENPQWLYTMVFTNEELWGPDADPTITISIDAFEPYLDPA